MQTLTLAVEDRLIDQVLAVLKRFSQDEVRVVAQQPTDLFSQTAGIPQGQAVDPVTWQGQVRSKEWRAQENQSSR
jgi:hypothetical protein